MEKAKCRERGACRHRFEAAGGGGGRDAVRARRGYLAPSIGTVLCCRLDLSARAGHSADVLMWDCEGPLLAKGHFNDHGSGCQLYCGLRCALFVATAFALLRGHCGTGSQSGRSGWAQYSSSAQCGLPESAVTGQLPRGVTGQRF